MEKHWLVVHQKILVKGKSARHRDTLRWNLNADAKNLMTNFVEIDFHFRKFTQMSANEKTLILFKGVNSQDTSTYALLRECASIVMR